MKKILCMIMACFLLTGCFKRDNFEDINIYTTIYPIEFITQQLYGENSNVLSIYPNGIDVFDYKLTDKQKQDYSKTDLFIFNGISDEKNYVSDFFKHNKNLKIIDATASMEVNNEMEELWLDLSNFLMISQNIRYGLKQYINNHYLKSEIDKNYNELKEQVSRLDADIYEISENATNKTIVASSDLFKILEKYDFNVISIEENDNLNEKTINEVTDLIENNKVHYIFMKQNDEISDTVQSLIDKTGVKLAYYHLSSNLTGEERNAKHDYLSIMSDNIDLIRNEVYD